MVMRNKSFSITIIALLLCFAGWNAQAQSETPKLEIGAHFPVLRFDDFADETTEPGLGGRIGYNVIEHVALEAEMNFFPREGDGQFFGGFGRMTQGLFGVKAGVRGEKVGVFGKARPGFIHYSSVPQVICIAAIRADCTIDKTNFAFDVGGVVEFYPSRRTVVRFDAGDLVIRRSIVGATRTTHNFQLNSGVGFRF